MVAVGVVANAILMYNLSMRSNANC